MNEPRVRLLLGNAALEPLMDRVEQRVRRGRPLRGTVTLPTTDPDVRAAVAALLGRPLGTGASMSVRLEDVDEIVRRSGAAPDLKTALALLRGPIPVAAEEVAAEQARWNRALAPLDRFVRNEHAELAWFPTLLRRTGRLKMSAHSATAAEGLVTDLVRVLGALPANGETLAAFSARVLHSAHALDAGPLRGLLQVALAGDLERSPDPGGHVWERVGIALDSSASSVLVHALRFDRADTTSRSVDDLVSAGRPVPVTLGMLEQGARPLASAVFVCENPSVVVAAADRLGAECSPVICVRGQPSVAAQRLLRSLREAGTTIRYHGDFDWGGIRIANLVMRRYGALPWRYRTEDLVAVDLPGAPLAGARVEASWDSGLSPALEARGRRLEEEQVMDSLLADLPRDLVGFA